MGTSTRDSGKLLTFPSWPRALRRFRALLVITWDTPVGPDKEYRLVVPSRYPKLLPGLRTYAARYHLSLRDAVLYSLARDMFIRLSAQCERQSAKRFLIVAVYDADQLPPGAIPEGTFLPLPRRERS